MPRRSSVLTDSALLARFVRDRRRAAGLSQRGLARAAAGVSATTVWRLERGEPVLFAHVAAVLAAFDCSLIVVAGRQPLCTRTVW